MRRPRTAPAGHRRLQEFRLLNTIARDLRARRSSAPAGVHPHGRPSARHRINSSRRRRRTYLGHQIPAQAGGPSRPGSCPSHVTADDARCGGVPGPAHERARRDRVRRADQAPPRAASTTWCAHRRRHRMEFPPTSGPDFTPFFTTKPVCQAPASALPSTASFPPAGRSGGNPAVGIGTRPGSCRGPPRRAPTCVAPPPACWSSKGRRRAARGPVRASAAMSTHRARARWRRARASEATSSTSPCSTHAARRQRIESCAASPRREPGGLVLPGPEGGDRLEAMKLCAYYYITKPARIDELEVLCRRRREIAPSPRDRLPHRPPLPAGRKSAGSPRTRHEELLATVPALLPPTPVPCRARRDGQELVARASRPPPRAKYPSSPSTAAVGPAESRWRSELFGREGLVHGRGVRKPGLFEVAERGVLFLDRSARSPA